jgi:hypothetical protein
VRSNGWNLIDVGSRWSADRLPRGVRGLVWVGDYDNGSCAWELADAALRAEVAASVGDRKIFGYLISDEPNPYTCPKAAAQHRARSALIHSVAPAARAVIVLDSNGFKGRATPDALEQMPLWKGTADYIGLDPYPCYRSLPCDFTWIGRTIRAADAAHLNYWGVVQAFEDSSWRWPSSGELSHMLDQWAASHESGYMTFAWKWAGNTLSSRPALLGVFRRFNEALPPWRSVVPRVVGSTRGRARAAITAATCVVGKVTMRRSNRPKGSVLAQQPRPGTAVPRWSAVDLLVSSGARP